MGQGVGVVSRTGGEVGEEMTERRGTRRVVELALVEKASPIFFLEETEKWN